MFQYPIFQKFSTDLFIKLSQVNHFLQKKAVEMPYRLHMVRRCWRLFWYFRFSLLLCSKTKFRL